LRFDRAAEQAAPAARVLDVVDPNLEPFFDRGGKLLLYHGWNDQLVAPLNSVNYYNRVVDAAGGPAAAARSVRLFMMPGTNHCAGGVGPNTFDRMAVMERWVERGEAPARISATHSTNAAVDRTRPLCAYPQVARYRGAGSLDDEANFVCSAP
jgi:feruloyl esterase